MMTAKQYVEDISIHALREEGDYPDGPLSCHWSHFYPRPPRGGRLALGAKRLTDKQISIHALREEGDVQGADTVVTNEGFLSTPSARRATCKQSLKFCGWKHFYPRPPRGGRQLGCHR